MNPSGLYYGGVTVSCLPPPRCSHPHRHHHHQQHPSQEQQLRHQQHHRQHKHQQQPRQNYEKHIHHHYGVTGAQPLRPVHLIEANQLHPHHHNNRPGSVGPDQDEAGISTATMLTMLQVMAAFIVAGFGNVGAGLILDFVKEWPVFLHVNELFILVPSLLGLKGNLEMTMAARLSTQANLGHMDNAHELLKMAKGNLALVQCQATVVSFVVAIFASCVKSMSLSTSGGDLESAASQAYTAAQLSMSTAATTASLANNDSSKMDHLMNHVAQAGSGQVMVERHLNGFDWDNALILCASSLLTANIACFVLGTLMILVIVGSHRVHIDPDNIAAPVAASLGDMTTAALLAVIAHSIYHYSENQRFPYLALVITLLFLGMLPVWICVARANPYTSNVLTKGWTPIVIAVFISSCGGFIFEQAKSRFKRLPVFQPVINGVGGNLVAVQASRLSTSLHRNGKPGQLPANFKLLTGSFELFLSKRGDLNITTARLLLLMSIPAHLLYFFVIRSIEGENAVTVTALFLSLYMIFAILQVSRGAVTRHKALLSLDRISLVCLVTNSNKTLILSSLNATHSHHTQTKTETQFIHH